MLSKKDHVAIAEILREEYTRYDGTGENDAEGKDTVGCIAGNLADYFEWDNSKFNRQKFLTACGLS